MLFVHVGSAFTGGLRSCGRPPELWARLHRRPPELWEASECGEASGAVGGLRSCGRPQNVARPPELWARLHRRPPVKGPAGEGASGAVGGLRMWLGLRKWPPEG